MTRRQRRLRLPRHRATTAQLGSLTPLAVGTAIPPAGVVLGVDHLAGRALFAWDPFTAYQQRLATNPNALVVGEPGVGKSTLIKTYALAAAHHGGRWLAVCDPKGEYGPLARHLDLTTIALRPGGVERLNPLDPHPNEADPAGRAAATVVALAATVLHRELTAAEDAAIGTATTAALTTRRGGRAATLADVVALLAAPDAAAADRLHTTVAHLAATATDVRWALGKLLDRQLRGMFDGASTTRLDPDGRGAVIDLSAVQGDPDALAVVLVAASSWLAATLATPGPPRVQILDEAWALLAHPPTARYLQSAWKLGRAWGVANIAVVHRLSDLRGQADDGTAPAKQTAGLLADTQTRVVFRQAADQAADAAHLLGLNPAEIALLTRLNRGRALWKIGAHTAVVEHATAGGDIVDTDMRMRP